VFITNHALAGAAIGMVVRRPAVAFVAGAASHIVMDMCLHWGEADLSWEEFVEVAKVDGTLGLAVCGAALVAAPPWARPGLAAAIAGACVIDMDKPGRHFFGRSPFPAFVDRFHMRIQNEHPVGWRVEAATAAGLVALAGAAASIARYRAKDRLPGRSRHGEARRPQHARGRW
jgi:hypothetical protein